MTIAYRAARVVDVISEEPMDDGVVVVSGATSAATSSKP